MISTTKGITENSPISVDASDITKKPSARKPLHQFSDLFDAKQKTAARQKGAAKMKHKLTRKVIYFCYDIQNRKGYSKINEIVKQDIYYWILNIPHIVKSPIENDRLKVSINGKNEKKLRPRYSCKCLSENPQHNGKYNIRGWYKISTGQT